MIENLGFWLWLAQMLFIVGVLTSVSVLIWRSKGRSYSQPGPPPQQGAREARAATDEEAKG